MPSMIQKKPRQTMMCGKARILLLLIVLSSTACGTILPPFPSVYQCQVNGSPEAFFCVNTTTHKHLKIPINDPSMKGAQCLSPDDYKKSEQWVTTVIEIAKRSCH